MNVLGIESSGPIGSAAACRDDAVLAHQALEHGMEQGRLMVSLVDRVIAAARWDKRRDVELIAVSQGPGSFTGLRVGLACAKMMAMLLDRPLVGVCSLDAMAENAPADALNILTVVDARRGQVYAAQYQRAGGPSATALRRVLDPVIRTPAELRAAVAAPVYVMGDGVRAYAADFAQPGWTLAPEELWHIQASHVARLGLALFRAGRRDDPAALEPIYLRLAEAEERRLARLATQAAERSAL
ncbi:MAG: tRNA (adenosine(37)-N6)-threonylcarbamoyltransferase complex dimerization subunit type 1 TsaB [Candidatus Brocadiia bacterium]